MLNLFEPQGLIRVFSPLPGPRTGPPAPCDAIMGADTGDNPGFSLRSGCGITFGDSLSRPMRQPFPRPAAWARALRRFAASSQRGRPAGIDRRPSRTAEPGTLDP